MHHDQSAVSTLESVGSGSQELTNDQPERGSPSPHNDGSGPWKFGDQTFVVHKVTIQPYSEALDTSDYTPAVVHESARGDAPKTKDWPSTVPLPFPQAPSLPYECSFLIDETLVPYLPTNPISKAYPFRPSESWPFEVIDTEHKGAAMFATRDIPLGGVILIEHPVIITPGVLHEQKMSKAYEGLYKAVRPGLRKGLKAMYNCMPEEECDLEEGIVRTNGTAVELKGPEGAEAPRMAEKMEYGAVFLLLDRANHSCGPNAAHKWDLQSLSSTLYALRPIKKGEEINITYTDGTAPRATRRERLYNNFRFTCQCPYCDLTSWDQIYESDDRRQEMRSWLQTRPSFTKWSKDLCRADDVVLQSHFEALDIIEREGLHGSQLIFLEEIALCYAVLGEEELFREWAQKVVDMSRIQDPENVKDFGKWLANPQSYKLWGWRKKQRLQMTTRKAAPASPLSSPLWGLIELTVEG
ncbi:hypothetical protein AX16_000894 [Volvariella volvacea WC 439]|nr:hypothetical protein AX16_000894 [Volvariella volvacea WC 439]